MGHSQSTANAAPSHHHPSPASPPAAPLAVPESQSSNNNDDTISALVADGKVDMRLVTMALWKNRSDSEFITKLCQELSKLIGEKPVLDQIEFYLPQLAHMVLHLEQEFPLAAMEQFVMLVAQSSVHFAMQFFWIIYAALDENRPKKGGSHQTFIRCTQLLLTLEQCIIYGSPVAKQAIQMYENHTISRLEMEQIMMADRRFFAEQNTGNKIPTSSSVSSPSLVSTTPDPIEGWLWKKGGGTSRMGRRSWNQRWCRIERRVMFVYNRECDIHARSVVPLDGAVISVIENPKHPFYFEIVHKYSSSRYKFSALSRESLSAWESHIKAAAVAPAPPASSPTKRPVGPARTIADMSEDMRTFVLQGDGGSPTKKRSRSKTTTTVVGYTKSVESSEAAGIRSPIDTSSSSTTTATITSPKFPLSPLSSDTDHDEEDILRNCSGTSSKTAGSNDDRTSSRRPTSVIRSWLSEEEQNRYDFFTGQRNFVKSITDMCEDLRSVEVPDRKSTLVTMLQSLSIPENCFLPLCNSTDIFQSVLQPCVTEGRVFTTNERVPCLMYFETALDSEGDNVSNALYKKLYGGGSSESLPVASDSNSTETAFVTRPSSSLEDQLLASEETKCRIKAAFGELWSERKRRIKDASPLGEKVGWNLSSFIAKSNDDLRQEVFVMQLISYFDDVFKSEGLSLRLQPYRIMSTGGSTGLLEVVQNATSIDGLKKSDGYKDLKSHFEFIYGDPGSELYKQAIQNFIHSLAAYSIVCYVLAIKDRHNGNILIDIDGNIVHIDFGFLLGRAPGGSFSIETAPFKLTLEMVELIGGKDSENYQYFVDLCVQGSIAIRKNAETVMTLVDVMSYKSTLPCFQGNVASIRGSLEERMFLHVPEDKVSSAVQAIVERAYNHFGTNKYDQFQTYSNGIAR